MCQRRIRHRSPSTGNQSLNGSFTTNSGGGTKEDSLRGSEHGDGLINLVGCQEIGEITEEWKVMEMKIVSVSVMQDL